jgi:hypothetical protein
MPAFTGYAGVVLSDTPNNYWRMHNPVVGANEIDVTASNGSANGNLGTYVSPAGATLTSAPGCLQLDADTAMGCAESTGTSPFMYAENTLSATPSTWEFWFRPTSAITTAAFAGSVVGSGSTSQQIALGEWNATAVGPVAVASGSGEAWGGPAGGFAAGSNHHVVCQWTGSVWNIFVDGVQYAVSTTGTVANFTGTQPVIGNNSNGATAGGNGTYQGALDEFAVYNHLLTPDRVLAHYLAGRAFGVLRNRRGRRLR